LPTGTARRTMTAADLNIPEPPDGADPLTAAPRPSTRVADPETGHLPASPAGFTIIVASNPAPVYAVPLFVAPGQLQVASIAASVPALNFRSLGDFGSLPGGNDAESWLEPHEVWARFADQPARAIPALEQTLPEAIPLIFENPVDIFRSEPTSNNREVSPQQGLSQSSAALDLVFAQMATDTDDFGDLSE
jgi:hypothetical protein